MRLFATCMLVVGHWLRCNGLSVVDGSGRSWLRTTCMFGKLYLIAIPSHSVATIENIQGRDLLSSSLSVAYM